MQQCFFCKVFSRNLVLQELPSCEQPSKTEEQVWRCADLQACERRIHASAELQIKRPHPWHVCSRCHHSMRDEELCYEQRSEAGTSGGASLGGIEYRCKDRAACTVRLRAFIGEEIERGEVEVRKLEAELETLRGRIEDSRRELSLLA